MDSPFNINTKNDAPEILNRVYARQVLVGKARYTVGGHKGRSLCNNNKGSLKSDNK